MAENTGEQGLDLTTDLHGERVLSATIGGIRWTVRKPHPIFKGAMVEEIFDYLDDMDPQMPVMLEVRAKLPSGKWIVTVVATNGLVVDREMSADAMAELLDAEGEDDEDAADTEAPPAVVPTADRMPHPET